MKIRWAFRCYPTPAQERILARTFGCCRFVYNHFLAERCGMQTVKKKCGKEHLWSQAYYVGTAGNVCG